MDNVDWEKVSHFEIFTSHSHSFIDILNGEIVLGGDYRNREECKHIIMQKEHANWDAVKNALNDFLFFKKCQLVEICKALDRDSIGSSIIKDLVTENQEKIKKEVQQKKKELTILQHSVDVLLDYCKSMR